MRFKAYGSQDELAGEGELTDRSLEIPTAGAIAIELPDGRWLNFRTSEWGWVQVTPQPSPKSDGRLDPRGSHWNDTAEGKPIPWPGHYRGADAD